MLRQTVSSLALLLALSACGPEKQDQSQAQSQAQSSGQQPPAHEAAPVTQDIHARLAAFFDKAMKDRLAFNPMMADRLGDTSNNDKWPELTDAAADKELALYKGQLAELHTFDVDQLTDAEKLSYRIFDITAKRYIANDRWRDYNYPVNQMFGWQTAIPTHLMTVHQVHTVRDALSYVKRLEGVKHLMDELTSGMDKRQAMGILPPKFVFPLVLTATENVLKGAPFDDGPDSILLADFRKKVENLQTDPQVKDDLMEKAKAALLESFKPGYEELIMTLKAEQAVATEDDGAWKFPDGDAYYAQMLKNNTTTDMTADQIHQLGLDNVARIHKEMKAIMTEVGFKGTLKDFFDYTRTDKRFYEPNTDEGRAAYLKTAHDYLDGMNAKVPEYFDHSPKAPLDIRAVEKYREKSAGKAFYNRGAPDGSRPGIVYLNLRDMSFMPTYQLEALIYHEGIPGHHFQISFAQELPNVPLFQRVARFTAFSEGWGLYTEELGKDMGFYKDPYSDFGRLAMELWRACRLVVDTGIHAKHWTREQAIDYLLENTPNPKGDDTAAIERYIVMPGQATAYMVGKLKIMELRDKAMADLGDKFDWRGFHKVVLSSGAVPLSILEENVDAWIKGLKKEG